MYMWQLLVEGYISQDLPKKSLSWYISTWREFECAHKNVLLWSACKANSKSCKKFATAAATETEFKLRRSYMYCTWRCHSQQTEKIRITQIVCCCGHHGDRIQIAREMVVTASTRKKTWSRVEMHACSEGLQSGQNSFPCGKGHSCCGCCL